MAAEESSLLVLLDLFDSYWFEHQLFKKKTISIVLEKREEVLELGHEPNLSRIPTLHVRSFSDQFLSSRESLDFLSPNSVLQATPEKKLQTILSGKEAGEPEAKQDREYYNEEKKVSSEGNIRRRRGRRKSKGLSSKSLSDLEFEELKGFVDLGFVFSEEDKNSSLVEIIPGLQRFGGNQKQEEEKKKKEEAIDKKESVESTYLRRPYLSQAWEIMEQREAAENMLKWRININAAVVGNEMDMKDQLRFWAQSVASTVK